ncbi:hypothetical protein [Nonomuraea sp. NPDC049480]|uniref:hypothetical protein n=1 Tax=Nonomuraea sp. NPDC049480 TaxID=3364353 RepID=UPI0037996102
MRDGSEQQEVPTGFQIPEPPGQSRFYVRTLRNDAPGLGLYDLKTGTPADLGIGTRPRRARSRSPTGPDG